jgi:23S rRNA (pseudouridine1915-N3)-methyltransferase
MVIRVLAVGRVRHAGLRAACEDYAGRTRRYLTLEVQEVREAGRRAADAATARRLEGERLAASVPAGATVVALTRTGSACTSGAFARRVGRWREEARDVAFLIGGAFGLDPDLIGRSEVRLRLAPFTLPHELARLVLLEQLYRAATILRGEPYHKGD